MQTLGQRVAERREELGISQRELGKRAGGLSQQAIDKIERGILRKPGNLPEIADALGVRPQWLRTGELPKLGYPHNYPENRVTDAQPAPVLQELRPPVDGRSIGGFMDTETLRLLVQGIVHDILRARTRPKRRKTRAPARPRQAGRR